MLTFSVFRLGAYRKETISRTRQVIEIVDFPATAQLDRPDGQRRLSDPVELHQRNICFPHCAFGNTMERMSSLTYIEQRIFDVDGIRASLSGSATGLDEYWTNRFSGDKTVAEFKKRFAKRYPAVDIELYDGRGGIAHGNRLMKNLRATHDFDWVRSAAIVYDEFIASLMDALKQTLHSSDAEPAPPDPYDVLGVDRNSSDHDIKRAYQRLISRFHTDRLESLQLDPAFIQFATERTQMINRAREQIREQRSAAQGTAQRDSE